MAKIINVVVPIYKVEQYLEYCLDSISKQSTDNYEIILVDDGSPDGCTEICDEIAYKNKNFVVVHKKNGGLSSARNTGIKMADGEYICFVDSDDWIAEDYLQRMYEDMNINSADMSSCNLYKCFNEKVVYESPKYTSLIYDNNLLYHAITNNDYCGYAWNKMFKTSIIKNNQILFDEKIFNGEDLPFVVEYLKYCRKVTYTRDKLYYYNIRPDSISTSTRINDRGMSILYAREKVIDILKETEPESVDVEKMAYLGYLIRIFYLLEPVKDKFENQYKEIKRKLKENMSDILLFKKVSAFEKIKFIFMVYFSFIVGPLYRRTR